MTTTPSAVGAETRAVVQRLEHIHVSVGDLDRSLAFYRDVFGFAVRWQDDTDYGRCAHVGTDTFYIALTEESGLKEARAAPGHAEVYHMGFTTEDLDALRARLERLGVEIAQEADRPEGAAIYLNDPDGHEIEIVHYQATYPYR